MHFAFENNWVISAYYYSPRVTWNVYELGIFYHWTTRNLARFVHTWSRLIVTQYYCHNHRYSYHKYEETWYRSRRLQEQTNTRLLESHLKNSQHRFVNIRDDSWVCVWFPLCTLCLCYVRHVHVSSKYMSGYICFVLMWHVRNQLHVRNYGV